MGLKSVVCTDGTWRQLQAYGWELGQRHRNRGEGVGYVEKIDARKQVVDWNKSEYDDSAWGKVVVIGSHPVKPWTGELQPDLTRIKECQIKPISIDQTADGAYVVDLGKCVFRYAMC